MSEEGSELVIGLVGAIGTDLAAVRDSLGRQLRSVGYEWQGIRVSHLLHDVDAYAGLASLHDRERYYDAHMDAGNEFCERVEQANAMALLAALQLRTDRTDRNLRLGIDPTGPTPRHAFIVNSLKRPEEIKVLREIYGDAFVALGVYTDRDTRRAILAARIAISKNKESDQCRHIAERLITRDETEATTFGQDVSHTFFRADAFIDATTLQFADDAIRRFVEVLFGHPFQTPTPNELGMQYAFSAALRSADLSRQVGAAICTQDAYLTAETNKTRKLLETMTATGLRYRKGGPR